LKCRLTTPPDRPRHPIFSLAHDAQRYRTNAAECLSAAKRCDPTYRGLTVAIAASWLSLARQQIAMDELLAIWSNARSATSTATSPQSFIRSTFTSPHSPLPPAGGYVAIPVGCDAYFE
jgi:hypothetical protein